MISSAGTSNFFIKMDRVCDVVPLLSTATNLIDLFQKYAVIPYLNKNCINNSAYYSYLDSKKIKEIGWLIIPVIGNIVVALQRSGQQNMKKLVGDHPLLVHANKMTDLNKYPTVVKLLICAANASYKNGRFDLDSNFRVNHLNAREFGVLYNIFSSYWKLESEQGKSEKALNLPIELIAPHFMEILDRHIFTLCERNQTAELIVYLKNAKNPSFDRLIFRIEECTKLFKAMNVHNKKQVGVDCLDDLYKNIENHTSNEQEDKFYCLFKVFDRLMPELQLFSYFFDCGSISGNIEGAIANGPEFKGIEALTEHFNTKQKDAVKYQGKLGEGAVELVDIENLDKLLDGYHQCGFIGHKKILVLFKIPLRGVLGHYSPLFLYKTKEKTTIIGTDSGGIDSPCFWTHSLKARVDNSLLKDAKFITFAPARQADGFSCSTTSFRDILESCKHDLFDYVNTSVKPEQWSERNGMHVISHYPPSFMKVAQGFSYLPKYEKEMPDKKDCVVASKSLVAKPGQFAGVEEKTLRNVVDAHTCNLPGNKKLNFYLRKRAFKYFKTIAEGLLARSASNS